MSWTHAYLFGVLAVLLALTCESGSAGDGDGNGDGDGDGDVGIFLFTSASGWEGELGFLL